jgi:acetyl esterase
VIHVSSRIWSRVRRRAVLSVVLIPLFSGQSPGQAPRIPRFTYKQTAEGTLDLLVDYPAGWRNTDHRAAVVFFFGGGWTGGSVEQFSRHSAYFAARGMVALRADYRIASKHHTEPDAAAEDARSAVRWIRAHASTLGIDPNRIVASGGSSGGHLAACTVQCRIPVPPGEDSSVSARANALVLFNPALDFTAAAQLPPPFSDVFHRFTKLSADTAAQRRLSPTWNIERGDPPTLVLVGTIDPLFASAQTYVKRMAALGSPSELYTAEGGTHGFFNESPWHERTLVRADEFLAALAYITGKPAISAP